MMTIEYLKLKPEERAQVAEKSVFVTIKEAGKNGITVARIMKATRLSRTTVSKYVLKLVAAQRVKKENRQVGDVKVAFYSLKA